MSNSERHLCWLQEGCRAVSAALHLELLLTLSLSQVVSVLGRPGLCSCRWSVDWRSVLRTYRLREVTGLNPDRATGLTPWPVHAARLIAQPAASRIGTVFVLEYAIKHQDLLTSLMTVGLKHSARRPTHQCNVLRAKGMQRQHLQPPDQTRNPGFVISVNH